jgi:peroxiredoxin
MTSMLDSASYAIGQDIGQAYKQQGVEIDAEAIFAGILSKLNEGEASQLTDTDGRQLVAEMMTELRQKQMTQQSASRSKVSIGQEAPEITLMTPEGKPFSLSSLRGKYVLVDFWASWCRPCRAENPNVVRVYNKYKERGFEILGVSLDRSKDAWVKAIEKDGLTWPHISDLKFWQSAAAQTYGVSAIPYTVLVDPEGKIIAQNLRGASLERKLEELLGA